MKTPTEVLEFWFGTGPILANSSKWYKKDPVFDQQIKSQFESLLQEAKSGALDSWETEAKSALALVILLDQFSRNVYRDQAAAFAQDEQALQISLKLIQSGKDQELHPIERWFLYMPLMHSEDAEVQNQSVKIFEQLKNESPKEFESVLVDAHKYAIKHAEIIYNFGRYPHRNAILGRTSTDEELEFLKKPGSSF